jgi:hypothetical protein
MSGKVAGSSIKEDGFTCSIGSISQYNTILSYKLSKGYSESPVYYP